MEWSSKNRALSASFVVKNSFLGNGEKHSLPLKKQIIHSLRHQTHQRGSSHTHELWLPLSHADRTANTFDS